MGSVKHSGWTLVELLLVVLIVGVLATVGTSRYFQSASYQEKFLIDHLLSTLQYAKRLAIASGCDIQVTLDAHTVSLHKRKFCTNGKFELLVRPLTTQQNNFLTAPSGFTFRAAQFYFNPVGQVISAGAIASMRLRINQTPVIALRGVTGYMMRIG